MARAHITQFLASYLSNVAVKADKQITGDMMTQTEVYS